MSSRYFKSLIALSSVVGLLIVWGGSVVAQQYTSEEIESEKEGPRLEVLGEYTTPGVITDSMLNAGKEDYTNPMSVASGQLAGGQAVDDYKAYSFTVLPLAVDGKIITGISDAETGEEVWKTHTIPAPDEPGGDTWPGDTYKYGGGSAWVTGAFDPELYNIYWGVGQPGPWDRHAHPGDNLYTNSTVVLDPDSGAIKFHFQYTPNDPYDYDGVNETVLADIDGQKVWLHADRNGHFYPVGRANGSFNYAVPLGKVNWNRGFDPETGRPIFAYPEMDVTREGIYPAPSGGEAKAYKDGKREPCDGPVPWETDDESCPWYDWNGWGWQGWPWHWFAAYNPETQIAYVPSYGSGDELRAINARNGELVWVHNNPMPFRNGVTATAGNPVFAGDTEGYIKAFNADTGWSFYYNGEQSLTGRILRSFADFEHLTVGASQAQTGIEMFDEKVMHQTGGHMITFGLD